MRRTPLSLALVGPIFVASAVVAAQPMRSDPPAIGGGVSGGESSQASVSASPTRAQNPALEAASRERLARILATLGAKAVRKDEISTADIDLGLIMCEAATRLQPDDVWAWRSLMAVATLGDPTDDRVLALRRSTLEQIARLDPTDEVIRLRRVIDAIERAETVEGRIAGYRTMLEPRSIEALGKPLAARLALDLALLLQRSGDQSGFEHWLSEAVALDPAFPAAVIMAAGYFRFSTDDPAKSAELLVAAMIADPLDPVAMRGLATALLDQGAYVGAKRFLKLAAHVVETDLPVVTYDEVLGDLALAQLASGDAKGAITTVRTRQHVLDEFLRNFVSRSDPTILGDPVRLAAQKFPLRPQLTAVKVQALRLNGEPAEEKDGWAASLNDLWRSLDGAIETIRKDATLAKTPEAKAESAQLEREAALEAAFAALWLGEDAVKAKEYLAQAETGGPVVDAARARFDAWVKLRTGEVDAAAAAFEALNDDSPLARLGKGLALKAAGRPRDAARELFALARASPGTLAGVSAKVHLEKLVSASIPNDETAARLEAVAASVPTSFDRLFVPNARVVRLRLRPGAVPKTVFDAIPLTLEITNESSIPLAIDPSGPLRNLVAIRPQVSSASVSQSQALYFSMLPIDRAFSVPPRTTLVVPLDLAYTEIGSTLAYHAAVGCGIEARSILNWEATVGGLRPGTFGDVGDSGLIRIDGPPVTDDWIDRAIAR
ncbi:MAG: hypothetical protein SGJ09_05055, partial [Phycisphaerae bacterium]|nr:hypothetical protein [Phycisphaerae bacterium]